LVWASAAELLSAFCMCVPCSPQLLLAASYTAVRCACCHSRTYYTLPALAFLLRSHATASSWRRLAQLAARQHCNVRAKTRHDSLGGARSALRCCLQHLLAGG
jgi:hypothetical protein